VVGLGPAGREAAGAADRVLSQTQPDELEKAQNWGIYIICCGDTVLDWGVNPIDGKKPFTFFKWEMDPANVYNKGLGSDLTPLQKRLNRLDSLIELAVMTNAVGKWLWPRTQQGQKPSGSPNEVIEYDLVGDGKTAPEFVLPHPFSPMVFQIRAQIIQDFQELGYSQGVQTGSAPEGGGGKMPFAAWRTWARRPRSSSTPSAISGRTAHQLRYEKCLTWARKFWTDERKAAIAGFNGRSAMQAITNRDLAGDYQIQFRPDSSRPLQLDEKFQMLQLLVESGLISVADQSTRERILDMTNMEEFDLTNYLQYEKAGRDLEKLKAGQIPLPNPNIDVGIHLKIFIDFTLTEEFEGLPPQGQAVINQAVEQLGMIQAMQQAAQAQQMLATAAANPNAALAGALAGKKKAGGDPLHGIQAGPEAQQQGATAEAGKVAAALP
jgi:hypothetical protein